MFVDATKFGKKRFPTKLLEHNFRGAVTARRKCKILVFSLLQNCDGTRICLFVTFAGAKMLLIGKKNVTLQPKPRI